MKLIGTDRVDVFSRKYNQARKPLADWVKKVRSAKWEKYADVKATFNSVDKPTGDEYIFDIAGNKYRLVAFVTIQKGTVIIDDIMTHEEYSKNYKK